MANIQIIQGDFNKKLELPIAEGLKADFPDVESVKNDEKRHGDIVSGLLD